jgi:hypothetical protein
MRILRVTLQSDPDILPELADFYGSQLGVRNKPSGDSIEFQAGSTQLAFLPAPDANAPFYHFALRIPRNRFTAASAWLEERAGLLADAETRATRFDFTNWNAEACYTHDPAGNILELIAHHSLPEETPSGDLFGGRELLGVCEIGLVGDDLPAMGRALQDVGLSLWDGTLDGRGRLAFMGGRDGVLILAPTGRGWVPTGRPAEPHPVHVVVEGAQDNDVRVPHSPHRVRTSSSTSVFRASPMPPGETDS